MSSLETAANAIGLCFGKSFGFPKKSNGAFIRSCASRAVVPPAEKGRSMWHITVQYNWSYCT